MNPVADTICRGFFRAGILAMFTAGGVFGAVLLGILAWQGDLTSLDLRAAIWAHAHAQIAGWVTFFVMGFGYQAFPRFKRVELAWPGLAAATLPVMAAGLALRVGAGFIDQTTVGQALGAAGGAAELFAVAGFIAVLAKTWSRATPPRQPWEIYVFAALGWMLLAFVVDVAVFAASALPGTEREWIDFIALYDAPWRDIQLLGFAGGMILGVSQRFLPFAYGFREPSRPVALGAFWLWNGAVAAEILLYVAFVTTRRMELGAAWLAAVAALPAAVLLLVRSMRVFARNENADRSLPFIRASFAWAFASFLMLPLTPLYSAAVGQAFSHAWFGAFRHALTVGFISLMIVGVSSKVVPMLAGVDPARLSSLRAAFWLLNVGCMMRVGFQVATDLYGWAFPPTALSAPVELAGFALWAADLLRAMRPATGSGQTAEASSIGSESRVSDMLAAGPRVEQETAPSPERRLRESAVAR
ncbi:MAG: NnrS family protein [Bryobacterales bacterium]|nr:NnrS family protein [Bryobacterales bacterium]